MKINIIKKWQKYYILVTFIFHHVSVEQQDNYMKHLLSQESSVFWRMHLRIHRYVAAPRTLEIDLSRVVIPLTNLLKDEQMHLQKFIYSVSRWNCLNI